MIFGAMTFTSIADSKITTTIDGQEVNKELTKLSFDDGNVILTFSDNTTETAPMNMVSISIDHAQSSIDQIITDPKKANGVYNLKGQYLGETPQGLKQGIYNVNTQKIYVR